MCNINSEPVCVITQDLLFAAFYYESLTDCIGICFIIYLIIYFKDSIIIVEDSYCFVKA